MPTENAQIFAQNTQLYETTLPVMTKPTGGGVVTQELPKNGILAGLFLRISATVTGSLSAPNALGVSSIIRNVRLSTNNALDLISVSGAQYGYLMQRVLGLGEHVATPQNQFNTAVTATTFNLDMVLPLQVNERDLVGLIALNNPQFTLTLSVDFESDANVATGATVAVTVTPMMRYYAMPQNPEHRPMFNILQRWVGEQAAVSAAGEYVYKTPESGIMAGIYHGLGIGVSGSDGFSRVQRRLNNSVYMSDFVPGLLDVKHRYYYSGARVAGTIHFDLLGNAGLGSYGLNRDSINTLLVTDYDHVITATGAGTLHTVRREFIILN